MRSEGLLISESNPQAQAQAPTPIQGHQGTPNRLPPPLARTTKVEHGRLQRHASDDAATQARLERLRARLALRQQQPVRSAQPQSRGSSTAALAPRLQHSPAQLQHRSSSSPAPAAQSLETGSEAGDVDDGDPYQLDNGAWLSVGEDVHGLSDQVWHIAASQ